MVMECSPLRDIIAVRHIDNSNFGHTPKARKVQHSLSILVLNIDFQNPPVFVQSSLVNCLVWVVKHETLSSLVNAEDFNSIFNAGFRRVITGHSPDKRRVYVKPPIPFTGDGKHEHCICVLLADVHQYIFLYECFKSTHSRRIQRHEDGALLQAVVDNVDCSNLPCGRSNDAFRA